MHTTRCSAVLLATALLAACEPEKPTAPVSESRSTSRASADVTSTTDLWADVTTGETGPGSTYAFYLPRAWNGDVVFYAHGIRDAADPVALPKDDGTIALRDGLGARGIAVAYSSWDENGYALDDAIRRTHQLRGLFASRYGQPTRSFLAGQSLGALAVLGVAEQHGSQYNGALPMCGVVGGTARQVQFIGNVRALFDVFYPGALPGNVGDPTLQTQAQVQAAVVPRILGNPSGMFAISSFAQTPIEFVPGPASVMVPTMLQSLVTPLVYHVRGFDDIIGRSQGHMVFDNSETQYTSPALPAAQLAGVNAAVVRTSATRDALNWLRREYEPTGNIDIPVVTLHNRWDPTVPFANEAVYAAKVASAGRSANLTQQVAVSYGHCNFTQAQRMAAVDALLAKASGN